MSTREEIESAKLFGLENILMMPRLSISQYKVLLLENIHPVAQEKLEEAGFKVDRMPGAWSEEELCAKIGAYQALGIRSKTELNPKVLENHGALFAIGCFCIGTNQVAVDVANQKGLPVFNAPYSNTRSVAELVICELIALSRQLCDRSQGSHQGQWLKSADGSREVRGKTLGIVGYGHIGSQVSIMAESMGLKVIFFDIIKKLPLGNAQSVENLETLLKQSDFVTLHVPETSYTQNMLAAKELAKMKKGSYLLNASRGTVVQIEDLVEALKSGHLAGAAIDVFPEEPSSNKAPFVSPLQGMNNVILTPHVGGSTEEAQKAIGEEVAESLIKFLRLGSTFGAVNFPNLEVPPSKGVRRLINVHRNVPGVLRDINNIVSEYGANILAQYLSTDPNIGYLIMDMEKGEAERVADEIRHLSTAIKTRVLF